MTGRGSTGGVAADAPVRAPAVAGSFYPADPRALRRLVRDLFEAAAAGEGPEDAEDGREDPIGVLVPHAGLVYSGIAAAAAWRRLAVSGGPAGTAPRTVVLLGTNHVAPWLDGVGAWPAGAWATPLGDVPLDADVARAIVQLGPPFLVDRAAHAGEHSLEVQLPLLEEADPAARIVPLAVAAGTGRRAVEAGTRLGVLLGHLQAGGHRIVLAISSDMAHYPPVATCRAAMVRLLPAILGLDAPGLARLEDDLRAAGTRGLACGMCGIEPAVLGLAALRAMGATHGTTLAMATSADAGGPPDRTVGYLAARFDA